MGWNSIILYLNNYPQTPNKSMFQEKIILSWLEPFLLEETSSFKCIVNRFIVSDNFNSIEKELIKKQLPLLIIVVKRTTLNYLNVLRNRCLLILRGSSYPMGYKFFLKNIVT